MAKITHKVLLLQKFKAAKGNLYFIIQKVILGIILQIFWALLEITQHGT